MQLREETRSGAGLNGVVCGSLGSPRAGGGLVHLKRNQLAVVCNPLRSHCAARMQAFRGTKMDLPGESQERMLGVAKKSPLTE